MVAVGSHLGVLVAVCTFACAISFLINFPSILSTPLQLYLSLPESQYAYLISALYSAYSIPNIFLPFFSGSLLRLCGERDALLLTFTSVALGQLVIACSIQMRMELGMIAGRFLFGLGGEIIGVLTYEILTRWFRNHFSIVLAIMISTTNLVIITATITMQRLCESHGVVASTWVVTWVALAAGFMSICYLACIRHEKPLDTESLLGNDSDNEEAAGRDTNQDKPNSLAVIASYPYVFWLLGMICILGQGSIETFGNSAQRYLASVFYAGDQRSAASALSIRVIVSSIAVPPLGYILDRSFLNRTPVVLLVASILLVVTHTLFLTTASAILPLAILGLASAIQSVSFLTSLSQCLFETVEYLQQARIHEHPHSNQLRQRQTGYDTIDKPADDDKYTQEIITTGFGCMTSVGNLANATIPILLAMAESAMGYEGLEMVFWVLGFLACLVAGHLVFVSRYIEL